MSFESLGLRAEIVRAVSEKGYSEPTPIQLQAIPTVLEQRDLMAGAQTGTGKTAGFTLPMLQRVMDLIQASGQQQGKKSGSQRPIIRALVLTPTRELAAQVEESILSYSKYLPLRSAAIFGGVKIGPQIKKLRNGVDIVVATPGRLMDHVNQNTVNLSTVNILVLDEADRMLDMGFMPDIRRIMKCLPGKRQTLFFSATFSPEIKRLANELLTSPALIEVARENTTAERVSQVVYPVDRNRKRELLSHLIGTNNWQQVLVFTRTKHGADNLSKHLITSGIRATTIHGNKTQGARSKALADFKHGKARVLVATDIAARGLDINQLPHVVNYELPSTPEDYIHRIGRTGRAGNEGEAMSLVCVDELKMLKDIERLIKRDISRVVIEDFEPDLSIKPEPINRGRGKPQGKPQARKQAGKQSAKKRSSQSKGNKSFSKDSSANNSFDKDSSGKKPFGKRASDKRSADNRSSDNRSSDKRSSDNKSSDYRFSDKKASGKKFAKKSSGKSSDNFSRNDSGKGSRSASGNTTRNDSGKGARNATGNTTRNESGKGSRNASGNTSSNSYGKKAKSGWKKQGASNKNTSFKGHSGNQRRSQSRAQVSA